MPTRRSQSGCRASGSQSAACHPAHLHGKRRARSRPFGAALLGLGSPPLMRPAFPKNRHVALSGLEQAEEAKAEGAEAILVPTRVAEEQANGQAAGVLPWTIAVDLSQPAGDADRCRSIEGTPASVRCPSSLEGRKESADAAARAAQLGEAILLDGLDRWYRMGPQGAGYCRSCELALVEFLRETYGEHVQPFDPLEALKSSALPVGERPFARQKEALRLAEAIEAAKRAVLRARDEARRLRGVEVPVLGRAGSISALALELCRHLDGLVFDLPSLDPMEALLPLLSARAALGMRPAIAELPGGATPAQVRLFAALTAACDTDLLLPANASRQAREVLAAHRKFLSLVRERFR